MSDVEVTNKLPMPPDIWIVWDDSDYYQSVIKGVFHSEEEAHAHETECQSKDRSGFFSVEGFNFGPVETMETGRGQKVPPRASPSTP